MKKLPKENPVISGQKRSEPAKSGHRRHDSEAGPEPESRNLKPSQHQALVALLEERSTKEDAALFEALRFRHERGGTYSACELAEGGHVLALCPEASLQARVPKREDHGPDGTKPRAHARG